jgi:hypothetical protein
MSLRVMSSVWEHFPKGGSDLLVMLALADWGDDEGGRIYPSMNAIAKKIRCDRRQAQRIVHKLIDTGYLLSEGNDNGGNRGDTRHYRINLERLTGDIQPTGDTDVTGDIQTAPRVTPAPSLRVTSRTRTGGLDVTQTVKEQPLSTSASAPSDDGMNSTGFDLFWQVYPKKVEKQDTKKVWRKLKPDDALLQTILTAVEAQTKSERWTRDRWAFIPHPTTWLNGRRWEDEQTMLPEQQRMVAI